MTSLFRCRALATCAAAALMFGTSAYAQSQMQLSVLWEVKPGGTDFMTTVLKSERDAYPAGRRGAIAYVPSWHVTGAAPIYRLRNGGNTDHMASQYSSEPGYVLDGQLAEAFTSSSVYPGLTQLKRLSNGSDHVTIFDGETVPGYAFPDNLGLYGWHRYNDNATEFNTLTAGGVTLKSNNVAGGSIWSWVWNGTEFIDTLDYGRQMQTALFWQDGGVWKNPTMAGSRYSTSGMLAGNRQGSPILDSYNTGNTQVTRTIPIEWDPSLWGGSDVHPILYHDIVMEKDVTLNYNSMGPVAEYVTKLTLGSALPAAQLEMVTGYMPSSFNKFYTYDPVSQTLTQVFPGSGCDTGKVFYQSPSGYGGVIIANAALDKAMGLYSKLETIGGPSETQALYNCYGSVSKWNATTHYLYPIAAGTTSYRNFVMSGTLTDVVGYMRALYLAGAL